MVMKICPNCLISISYQKNVCHQCGYEIDKPPKSSPDILPRIRSSKPTLLHKFKFSRTSKLKLVDWQVKISNAHIELILCLLKINVVARNLDQGKNLLFNNYIQK